MIQKESYLIANTGRVKGNNANYSVDLETGLIMYDIDLSAKVGFFSKSIKQGGSYQVMPGDLKSSGLSAFGAQKSIGPLHLTVIHVDPGVATASVSIDGQKASGTAQIDISGDCIKLISLQAVATLYGFDFQLNLTRQ